MPSFELLEQQATTLDPRISDVKADLADENSRQRVAVAAYYKAEARGFAPGYELEDWLAAEAGEK
ncbi:MAG: DUF2934 domain-containing protein [Methylophilaceae bacterium]|nr:DUF2934 domain-containing protein [Methylophilaceae bacterium]